MSGAAGRVMAEGSENEAPKYRIGLVARLTGISTHQLRVWERRYHTVTPARSEGGDRLYSDRDVARLRALKKLSDLGHSIGQVARLSEDDLAELLNSKATTAPDVEASLLAWRVANQFLEAMGRMDVLEAERTLGRAAVAFEPQVYTMEVLLPALNEVGRRWATGEFSIAQEHGASAVLRTQLGALMRLYTPDVGARVVVCATLANELHEFGALAAGLLAAGRGWKVVYLGPNLPSDEIGQTASKAGAELVLISVVVDHPGALEGLVRLRALLPAGVNLIVGGAGAQKLKGLPRGIQVFESMQQLERVL